MSEATESTTPEDPSSNGPGLPPIGGAEDLADLRRRYTDLLHAVQSGVAACMARGADSDTKPKQLRVGVNAAMCDHAALVALLISKGLFTEREYLEQLVRQVEAEVETYCRRVEKLSDLPPGTIELA